MITKTELRWSYVPADLFEPGTQVSTSVGNWTFGDGFANLQLPAHLNPVPSNLFDAHRPTVEQMLAARAFDVGRSAQIVGHANTYHHSAAGVSQVIVPVTGIGALASGPASIDMVITDGTGKVLHDSAKVRRDAASKQLQVRARRLELSPDLAFLYDCYIRALAHPEAGLIHLFDIIERLEEIFPRGEAIKRLAIKGPRKALGILANDEPIIEGRHTGQHDPALLRHITPEEETEAREAARGIISAFEAYIDLTAASSAPS